LAERAVVLLDKLSRCVIHPYTLYGSLEGAMAIQMNSTTDMSDEGFRNDQDGPMLITRARLASAVDSGGGPFSNVSFLFADESGHHRFNRDAAISLGVFDFSDGTWRLDQPYVLDRRSSILVQVQELNVGIGSEVLLSLQGEIVLGEMTGEEVEEAVLLGIYPVAGRQAQMWPYLGLFGERPPRLKGEARDILDSLRETVGDLRSKLVQCEPVLYAVRGTITNAAANSTSRIPWEDLRNEQGGPFAATVLRIWVTDAYYASAAVQTKTNFLVDIKSVNERIQLTRNPTLTTCVVSYASSGWVFDHPHVVQQTGTWDAVFYEHAATANNDVLMAISGEVLRGMEFADVRKAINLGLYPLQGRYFE